MELTRLLSKTIQWHHDRDTINGATDWTQSGKLLEEFIELIAAQYYEKSPEQIANTMHEMVDDLLLRGRIKSVSFDDRESAKLDAVGDMMVVLANIAERNQSSLETCLSIAYNEIKDRSGVMRNGMFIKEADL